MLGSDIELINWDTMVKMCLVSFSSLQLTRRNKRHRYEGKKRCD